MERDRDARHRELHGSRHRDPAAVEAGVDTCAEARILGAVMSGGAWNYQRYRIEEQANRTRELLMAVAKTEEIVDRAETNDDSKEDAARRLYDLWVETFDRVLGR